MAMKHYTAERAVFVFWSRVNLTANDDLCWEWMGARNRAGYGHLRFLSKDMLAHRVAWELTHGAIPDGLFACHHCDNPACVNPKHLFLGTPKDNMQDMINKNRKVLAPLTGERHPRHKLTAVEVAFIRDEYLSKRATQVALGKRFGVTQATIGYIVRGVTWRKP